VSDVLVLERMLIVAIDITAIAAIVLGLVSLIVGIVAGR
jgi:hypothetical protein